MAAVASGSTRWGRLGCTIASIRMNIVEAAMRAAAADLRATRRQWALVGGFAVAVRAEARFTRDVDIAVAVADDQAAEAVVREMVSRGYSIRASIEQETTGRLATIRLGSPSSDDDDVIVDLLFASSGIEPEIAAAAEVEEIIVGLKLPVAQTGHLIALKLLARDDERRPQDLADLRMLIAVATEADLTTAREGISLITQRGYDRGRDLSAALAELLNAH